MFCGRIQQCLIGFRGKVRVLEALWLLSLEPTCIMAAHWRWWWIVSWPKLSGELFCTLSVLTRSRISVFSLVGGNFIVFLNWYSIPSNMPSFFIVILWSEMPEMNHMLQVWYSIMHQCHSETSAVNYSILMMHPPPTIGGKALYFAIISPSVNCLSVY